MVLEASALTKVHPLTEEDLKKSSVKCRGNNPTSLNRLLSTRPIKTNHKTNTTPGFSELITFPKRSPSFIPCAWKYRWTSTWLYWETPQPMAVLPSQGSTCACVEDPTPKGHVRPAHTLSALGDCNVQVPAITSRWQQRSEFVPDGSSGSLQASKPTTRRPRVRQLSNGKALRHKLIIQPPEDNC